MSYVHTLHVGQFLQSFWQSSTVDVLEEEFSTSIVFKLYLVGHTEGADSLEARSKADRTAKQRYFISTDTHNKERLRVYKEMHPKIR